MPSFLASKYAPLPPALPCLQNTITDINDVRQDDDKSPLDVIRDCSDLTYPIAPYNEAAILCRGNAVADEACPPNSYQVMMVPDLNEDDEKDTAFKVCGLCPAGTHGEGFGCTTCPAGSFSKIGEDCQLCPAGTYSNAGEQAALLRHRQVQQTTRLRCCCLCYCTCAAPGGAASRAAPEWTGANSTLSCMSLCTLPKCRQLCVHSLPRRHLCSWRGYT